MKTSVLCLGLFACLLPAFSGPSVRCVAAPPSPGLAQVTDRDSRTTSPVAKANKVPMPEQLPPPRNIPGINAPDRFPQGCVDCHINMPAANKDERISTIMAKMSVKAKPEVLSRAQAAAPAGLTLTGMHPALPDQMRNFPKHCLTCHIEGNTTAPPFGPLMHALHLTRGKESHFLTLFQGECTHCHKLDPKSGAWSILSAQEK